MEFSVSFLDFERVMLGLFIWDGYEDPEATDKSCTIFELGLILIVFTVVLEYKSESNDTSE